MASHNNTRGHKPDDVTVSKHNNKIRALRCHQEQKSKTKVGLPNETPFPKKTSSDERCTRRRNSSIEQAAEGREEAYYEKKKAIPPPIKYPPKNPVAWRYSSAKKDLTRELQDPTSSLRSMSVREIHSSQLKYSCYDFNNFSTNVKRIAKKLGVTFPSNKKSSGKSKTNKDGPSWRGSNEQLLLRKILRDKKSSLHKQTSKEIYKLHAGFQQWEFKAFKNNYRSQQKAVQAEIELLEFEDDAFLKEQISFPQNELGNRGYPLWGYHPANGLLKNDVKSGRVDEMNPMQLWESNAEYKKFPHKVFLGHIHQEKRAQREHDYWIVKRNKDAGRKKDKEVEKMKRELEEQHYVNDYEEMVEGLGRFEAS